MTAPVHTLPSLCSGIFGERLPLRYYLSGGMVLSGLFTALFGLGYFWDIHVLWYFIVVQVRPCWRMPRLWILPLWPHPGFSVAFRDQGGPVSEGENAGHFHSPQNLVACGVGAETTRRTHLTEQGGWPVWQHQPLPI